MALLTETTGELSYNEVTFRTYSSKVTAKPVYDAANRARVAVEYSVEVRGWVADAINGTDSDLETMRRNLTEPAGQLRLVDKGFGELVANDATNGTAWDAQWGPHPELLTWTPVGHSAGAQVEWHCKVTIPECVTARYRFGIMEYTYDMVVDVDEDGYLTVTRNITVAIPMTRQSVTARRLSDHVDRYKSRVLPPTQDGFHRTVKENISADKRRMTLVVTDRQVPMPLPEKTTKCDLAYELSSRLREGAFVMWKGTLGGTITMAAGENKEQAYEIFNGIMINRMSRLQRNQGRAGLRPGASFLEVFRSLEDEQRNGGFLWAILDEFRVRDEVTGRSTDFHAAFTIFSSRGLVDIMPASGMWTALPGTDFQRWRTSLNATAWRPGGSLGYQAQLSDDVIVDLCGRDRLRPAEIETQREPASPKDRPRSVDVRGARDTDRTVPPPENSWLSYECHLEYSETPTLARHKPMGGRPREHKGGFDAADAVRRLAVGGASAVGSESNSAPDILQHAVSPSATVTLVGRAMRLGHKVPRPEIESVGGVPAVLDSVDYWREGVFSRHGSLCMHAAEWVLCYQLPNPPARPLPRLANPVLGIDGRDY